MTTVSTPAPAISGARSTPSSERITNAATVHTNSTVTLRSTEETVSTRWARRRRSVSVSGVVPVRSRSASIRAVSRIFSATCRIVRRKIAIVRNASSTTNTMRSGLRERVGELGRVAAAGDLVDGRAEPRLVGGRTAGRDLAAGGLPRHAPGSADERHRVQVADDVADALETTRVEPPGGIDTP